MRATSAAIALVVPVVMGIAGCQAPGADTEDSVAGDGVGTTEIDSGDTSDREPVDQPAEFFPDLAAASNLPYFEQTLSAAGAGSQRIDGSAVVDALVDAGFDSAAIDRTPDQSLIALPADSVSVAVEFAGECLIGQYSTTWLSVDVAPLLPDGGCLVHETETLD